MDAETTALLTLGVALATLIAVVVLATWQERAASRRARAQAYPSIIGSLDTLLAAVDRAAPDGAVGMSETEQGRLRVDTGILFEQFQVTSRAYGSTLTREVRGRLVECFDAYRILTDPTPQERIALAGLRVFKIARDGAVTAMRNDVASGGK